MYVVTLGFQIAPGNRIVSIRVTSRYNFQCYIWKNLIKQTSIASKGRVHRHLGQKLPLDIIMLAVETPPIIFSNAIFSRKSPILYHMMWMGRMQWHVDIISPMEIVSLAFQLTPVIISSTIFDRIRYKYTYITSKRRVHRHLGQNLPLDIITLAVETPPVIISNAIFSRMRSIL